MEKRIGNYRYPSKRSLENLKKGTPFKKGQSGNPKGRPKLPDIKQAMADLLANEKDGMSALEAILKTVFAYALKGDMKAAQMLLDRGYGLPTQDVEVKNEVKVIFTREK